MSGVNLIFNDDRHLHALAGLRRLLGLDRLPLNPLLRGLEHVLVEDPEGASGPNVTMPSSVSIADFDNIQTE
jgi:hypothetical protein